MTSSWWLISGAVPELGGFQVGSHGAGRGKVEGTECQPCRLSSTSVRKAVCYAGMGTGPLKVRYIF